MKKTYIEKYNFYIGFKDKNTFIEYNVDDIKKIVTDVCKIEKIGFTMKNCNGSYTCNDGTYITENSLELTISGINEEKAKKLALTFKKILNQECVIVTKELVDTIIV